MTSPKDEFEQITRFQMRSLDELARAPEHLPPPLMKGLVTAGELTVFRADPGVEVSEFMYLLARCLATNCDLGPFVTTEAMDVTLLVGGGHAAADAAYVSTLQEYDRDWTAADTRKHLSVYHRHWEKDASIHLDNAEGRNILRDSLTRNTKVVILDDITQWLTSAPGRRDDEIRIELVLKDLAQRGIALIVFDQATKVGDRFCDQYLTHATNLVRLTRDACAPTEIGGGFNIVRKKVGLNDKLPTTTQWWWAVIDGEFKTGWEFRDPASELSAKDIAIAERQILVRQYAATGWNQKAIAKELGINQATVSRDLANGAKPQHPLRCRTPKPGGVHPTSGGSVQLEDVNGELL